MFKIRNPFKRKNVNIAKVAALKQLQLIELQKGELSSWINRYADLNEDWVDACRRLENFKETNKILFEEKCRVDTEINEYANNERIARLEAIELQDQQLKDAHEIMALKAIVSNLRKQKVYSGQKFYNPEDHKAPTVYLCARWNDWYVVRQSNELTPSLITAEQWKETYGHLVVMPQMNSNLKNLS